MRPFPLVGLLWRSGLLLAPLCLAASLVLARMKFHGDVISFYQIAALVLAAAAIGAGIGDYGTERFMRELNESVRIALAQIRANKLRSALTALGVVIGIVAVTLMGTAILGIDAGVERSLAGFGDDVLYVTKWPWRDASNDWWVFRNRREIDVNYAQPINDWIAEHPDSAIKVAVPDADWGSSVIRNEYKVNSIRILGTSADLGRIVKSDMKEGRFFTDIEARGGRNVAVIGFDVADALFPNESPLGKTIRIRSQVYTVVGVAARQGSFLGLFSWDSQVILPLSAFGRIFPIRWADPSVRVQYDLARKDEAIDELRGILRRLRGLRPEQKDDFEINSQQVVREQIEPTKVWIARAGFGITGLALFVGAINIMNITFVSVKERTKEIGTRKALGARRRTILLQFLIEAVSIAVLGGLLGLLVAWGLFAAAGAMFPSFPLVFSLGLVLLALGMSILAGVLSGFVPALTASRLDPVVALRYE